MDVKAVEVLSDYPYLSSDVVHYLGRMSVDDLGRQSDPDSVFHCLAGANAEFTLRSVHQCEEAASCTGSSLMCGITLINPVRISQEKDRLTMKSSIEEDPLYNSGAWPEATDGLNKVCVEMKTSSSFHLPMDSFWETPSGSRIRKVIDCRFLNDIDSLRACDYLPQPNFSNFPGDQQCCPLHRNSPRTLMEIWLIFGHSAWETADGLSAESKKLFCVNQVTLSSDKESDEFDTHLTVAEKTASLPMLLSSFRPPKDLSEDVMLVIAAPHLDQNLLGRFRSFASQKSFGPFRLVSARFQS